MSVLKTYASKHGSTYGIAERIIRQLQRLKAESHLRPIDAVTDPEEFRVMVIGSAMYYSSSPKGATEFVRPNEHGGV